MVLYYEDLGRNGWVKTPITIQDIKRILGECKVIDIKEDFFMIGLSKAWEEYKAAMQIPPSITGAGVITK